ncbi:hypothetical protein EDC31_101343 [Acidomonas methanolica]|nr:hypothetical protein EDC31_101343 [Acidomonas methanolica]
MSDTEHDRAVSEARRRRLGGFSLRLLIEYLAHLLRGV